MTCCQPRCDPAQWKERTDPKRADWLLTECGTCGKFIGYRRLDDGKKKTKALEWEREETVEAEDLFAEEV